MTKKQIEARVRPIDYSALLRHVGEEIVKGKIDVVGQIRGVLSVRSRGKTVSFYVGKKPLRKGDRIHVLGVHPSGDRSWLVFKPRIIGKTSA